jgi:hypothetical protein
VPLVRPDEHAPWVDRMMRGERNVLAVPSADLARMSSNPFFPYLVQRIEANRPDPEAALESRAVGLPSRVLFPTDFSEIAGRAKPQAVDEIPGPSV